MRKDPESHYNLDKLHMYFAIAAVILLGAIGGMVMNDYNREWKDYQAQFRTMEIEKSRMKFDAASKDLEGNSEYQAILEDIEGAKKTYEQTCGDLNEVNAQIKNLTAQNNILIQEHKFAKTELDVAKYNYEAAIGHHHEGAQEKKQHFDGLISKTNELQVKLDNSTEDLKAKQSVIDQCDEALKKLERQKRSLTTKADLLQRKLGNIDPNEMNFINRMANMIRDIPILDMSNPNYKVQQLVIKDISDDVIFKQVPRVERCTTCHLGVTNPDFKDAPQPFTTHPNLDQYVGNDSPHPIEEFGCTVCHDGRPRGTGFVNTVHVPSSDEQMKEWEEKYGWHQLHYWDKPMIPTKYAEAGCFKCHNNDTVIKGAEKLNLGLQVIEKAGCYGCHVIDKYEGWPDPGPNLANIASKTTKDWAYKWIQSPKSFRHNTWMPSYFNQANNSDPQSKARSEQEIHAIVHFLFENSAPYELSKVSKRGKFENGKELVASLGCMACHNVESPAEDQITTRASLRQEHGPALTGLGSKTSKEWLFNWLKNPAQYHAGTRMPDMRLSDQEAADIVEYLANDKASEFDNQQIPPVNEKILNDITLGFIQKFETKKSAEAKVANMELSDKLAFSGEKLVGQYGCYACHNIKGFENAKPIGVELTEEGSKPVNKLDFGFVHDIGHTNYAWFSQKLKDPRIFDKDKIKEAHEKLLMPNFYLSDEEIEAVVTALMGFVSDVTVANKKKPRTPENLLMEEGQKIVRQMNCQGCHVIEGDGGTIKSSVKDWLVNHEGLSANEAETIHESFSPPNLHGVGKKLNPEWLFNFLHNPEQEIRPWVEVRMPTYNFNVTHLNMLVKYFNTLDKEEFPFDFEADTQLSKREYEAAEKLFSTDYLGCTQCHVVGDQMPSGTKDSWAPDLALAKTRLKPEWVTEWIKGPSELMPGTKMPTFYDPDNYAESGPPDILDGNEDEQIRVLRNFLFSLTDHPNGKKGKPASDVGVTVDQGLPASE